MRRIASDICCRSGRATASPPTKRCTSSGRASPSIFSPSATGSASRIARLCLLAEPPTLDRGEVTDKGSINQRAVLTHRAETVEALHADTLHTILKPQ